MRLPTTIKEYTNFGYIVYTERTHNVVCASGLPEDIARYAKLHSLNPGKCWIAFNDGVYEVESREQVAMDHKRFVMALSTAIDNLNKEHIL